jgi:hypothetical protein
MPSYSGIFTLQTQMQAKAASNWPDPNVPSVIGQAFGGGYYAGQIGVSSVATHYLIVGPVSTAQQNALAWKNTNTATPGADSNINGPQNTDDMVADGNSTVYPAAHFCNNLVIGGYSDWYMPASNELEVCYYNLKPTTATNNTGFGGNPNAVPARGSNYTSGNPAQTTAAAFQAGGTESFTGYPYWSSTEFSASEAKAQDFSEGNQYNRVKNVAAPSVNTYRLRAIRRIPV